MSEADRVVEELASYSAAMTAAFQVLIRSLQQNGALQHGQFHEDLRVYPDVTREAAKTAILTDLRRSLLE